MAQIYEKYKFPIMHDESDYINMMGGLLPKGVIWGLGKISYARQWIDTIWSADVKQDTISSGTEINDTTAGGSWTGGTLAMLYSVFGSELSRIEEDAWDVLNGTDPGITTGEYLADWERNLGLPDTCSATAPTVEERQISAHVKLFGGYVTTTLQEYEDYAESLGYTITIDESPDEYQPRLMGLARMGLERMGGLGGYLIMEITVTDGDGTMEFFECKMNDFKPAHAILTYVDAR